ncbi:PREDICTED: uncharacterized protein LOC105458806, partial [Wasmannia auropunctata]|uniref:uncharacterized protein LOC105458806 n=1 Tax=Wasmannia auropunctata TaxID=64793 RepID=UPI0005ED7669
MVGYCHVCKIGAEAENDVSFHQLPKDKETKASWFAFIGHKIGTNSGICSKHFKQSDFVYKVYRDGVRRFLKRGTCPSIRHPQNTTRINIDLPENICISSRIENDINLEANITIKEESITIDETLLNTENLMDIQLKSEFDDPLAITEHDLEINKMLNNEIQESISTDETIHTKSINNQLKRKKEDSFVTKKRYYNPRYVGDLCREDFTSYQSWRLFQNYLVNTKAKLKCLNFKVAYLHKK